MVDGTIPNKNIEDTVIGKVTNAVMPGLIEQCASENLHLVEFNLTGSFNSKLLGVKTLATNWVNAGAIADVAASSPSPWASHIMNVPALSMRYYGKDTVLSTAPKDNFFGNSNRSMNDFNMYKGRVYTGPDEGEVIRGIVHNNTIEPLYGKRMVLADGTAVEWTTTGLGAIRPEAGTENDAAAYVSMLGYRLAKDIPFLFYHSGFGRTYSAIDFRYEVALNLKKFGIGGEPSGDRWPSNIYGRPWDPMRTMISCEQPGMKYITIFLTSMGGRSIPSSKVGSVESPMDPISFGSGWMILAIPVVDDGSAKRVNIYRDDIADADYLIVTKDYRYTDSSVDESMVSNVVPDWRNIALLTNSETYATPDGAKPWKTMPTTNYASALNNLGANFLLYLAPPIPAQHYVLGPVTKTSKMYAVGDGKTITVDSYNASVTLFCCKFGREWYADYYTTGFGLYQPRNSTIQKNILEKWNALQFTEFGICVDKAMSSVSPKICDTTDLAVRYKKARRQACKEDDWDKQKYSKNLTYGELKARIAVKPTPKAFYSIDTFVQEPDFDREALADVVWARVDGTSYSRKEGAGEATNYPINNTTRDVIVVELSQGAVLSTPLAQLAADFGLTGEQVSGLSQAVSDANSGYLRQQPDLVGYVLAEQYYHPGGALAMSGYPIIRFMASPFREACIMRSYADLDRLGDPLLRIIESFTGKAILTKLGVNE